MPGQISSNVYFKDCFIRYSCSEGEVEFYERPLLTRMDEYTKQTNILYKNYPAITYTKKYLEFFIRSQFIWLFGYFGSDFYS